LVEQPAPYERVLQVKQGRVEVVAVALMARRIVDRKIAGDLRARKTISSRPPLEKK